MDIGLSESSNLIYLFLRDASKKLKVVIIILSNDEFYDLYKKMTNKTIKWDQPRKI